MSSYTEHGSQSRGTHQLRLLSNLVTSNLKYDNLCRMDAPIRKTRRAWDEPGHAHYVTYSCFRRWPLLTRERTRRWVIHAIEHTRQVQNVAVWAYVIMPEHVHVLLLPRRGDYAMRRILASLKFPVARAAKEYLIRTGQNGWIERLTVSDRQPCTFRFWQPGGGYDHNVFKEKTVETIVDYIHANPVRRGLTATPTDWEWSSARFWKGKSDVPLKMDHPDAYVGS